MTKDEALKLALEALQGVWNSGLPFHNVVRMGKAIAAIKEALAQPEQEPDLAEAFRTELDKLSQRNYELRMENARLKAQPEEQQSCDKQEPLTEAEIWQLVNDCMDARWVIRSLRKTDD